MSKKVKDVAADAKKLGAAAKSLSIEQPKIQTLALEITGTAPIIQSHFSQKSLEQMLRKHIGHTVQREPKRPRQLIEDAKIRNLDGRICIPPAGIKKGMLTAAAANTKSKKTHLRVQIFIVGHSIPITFETETPRMDIVRNANKAPDVRFRPQFSRWKARLVIQFSDVLSQETVIDLLNRAGSVGVCEWRPERDGTFGTYRVTRAIETAEEIAEVIAECSSELEPYVIPAWAMDMDIDTETLAEVFAENKRTPGGRRIVEPGQLAEEAQEEEYADATDAPEEAAS